MWEENRYKQMKARSAQHASVATYTCAGAVRRNLSHAGFLVEKTKGFGRKRTMLTAQLRPHLGCKNKLFTPLTATVIGSGLAGSQCAAALAQWGCKVTVLEKNNHIASEASGNAVGLLFMRLSHDRSKHNRINAQSYINAIYQLKKLTLNNNKIIHQQGLMQIAFDENEEQRQNKIKQCAAWQVIAKDFNHNEVKSKLISEFLEDKKGLYFPYSCSISPAQLCKELLSHNNIKVITGAEATGIHEHDEGASVEYQQGRQRSAIAIVTTAWRANALLKKAQLNIKPSRGQITQISIPEMPQKNAHTLLPAIPFPLCQDGYIAQCKNTLWVGASYEMGVETEASTEQIKKNNAENLKQLEKLGVAENFQAQQYRTGIRCHSNHYLPQYGQDTPHVYYLTGLGSKGIAYGYYHARKCTIEILIKSTQ